MVLSLSANGLAHGETSAHLAEVYEAEVSEQTISTITDSVMGGIAELQARSVDRVYPVKIRDGQAANRPIYLALAVTAEGHRDILGLWASGGRGEGSKYLSGIRRPERPPRQRRCEGGSPASSE